LPARSATAFAATASLGSLAQFLFGDLAVAVLVGALHAFPRLGRHFILGDEAVAILVERLKVWALATFAIGAAGTAWSLSWSARSALSARAIRRWDWWAARWGFNCNRSGCERECEECRRDECECFRVHVSMFLSVTGFCLKFVGGDKDSSADVAFITAAGRERQ
jgi:hypothetical protein